MTTHAVVRGRSLELALILVLGVLFALTIVQSWGGALDPIADTGRDLYIPEKIAEGELKLYTDVSYLYPPLAPYLLASVVKIAGSNLVTMRIVGIVVSALVASLLFLIGRRIAGSIPAAILVFLFVTLHMTGVSGYSFNFIFPYSHNAIFGFLFMLLFLYALLRYVSSELDGPWLWIALVAGTLAGWSKIEYAAVFLLMIVASMFVRRPAIVPLVAAAAWNLGLLGLATIYFGDAPPARHWLTRNVLPESLLGGEVARSFYAKIQGLDEPIVNLGHASLGAVLIIAGILALLGIERLQSRRPAARIAGTGALALVFALTQLWLAQHFLVYRGFFLVQILLIPWAIRDRRRTPLFLMLVFSFLLGYRVLLRLDPGWYGFLFSIPAEIVLVYLLFRELPRREIYRPALALAWIPLLVLIGVSSLMNQHDIYESRRANAVTTSKGTFHDRLRGRAEILEELFEILERRDPVSMAVIPEGLALNWLTEIPTSIPYHTFSPAEMPDSASQEPIIEAFRTEPPEIVVHVRRDYGEFGFRGIGIDYGNELMREILCTYEPVWRRQNERFYVVILERRPERTCA